jgi:hypothetical protein
MLRYPSSIVQDNTLLTTPFSTQPNQLIWSLMSVECLCGLVAYAVTSLYLSPSLNDYEELVKHAVPASLFFVSLPFAEWLRGAREILYTSVFVIVSVPTVGVRGTRQKWIFLSIGSHMPNSKLRNATASRNTMQSTYITKANAFFLLVTATPIILLKDCVKYCVFNL